MGILVAIAVFVAGAVGAGAKSGVFKKGAETTKQDTYAFERHALETKLAKIETKQRHVYALSDADAASVRQTAQLHSQQEKLQQRIASLKQAEDKMASEN